MSKSLFSLCAIALISCGCHNDSSSNGTSVSSLTSTFKTPIVSVVPVIDNTKNDYEWNLSDELSSAIYANLSKQDRVILNSSSKVRAKSRPALEKHNPFDRDLSWVKKSFQDEEFIVFIELVEHEEVLNQSRVRPQDPSTCSAELRMAVRVRVIDLRSAEPRVVLQELIHDAHQIHPQFNNVNFYQVPWKDQSFSISPVGLAHTKLTKELSSRIEDYILIAVKK
jgi:hypothetical protein